MSVEPVRWVDKIPASVQRSKQTEVLCLGLSRTGTMSLYTALNKLGYRSYHYIECRNNREYNHIRCWQEALRAKLYGTGKPYGRTEFDRVLANYNAVTDAPCANLAENLLKAYPDAKVALNVRDVDSWLASMETSYYAILGWRWLRMLGAVERISHHLTLLELILSDWTSDDGQNRTKLRKGFIDHYRHIRTLVPEDRLLEHRPGHGWAPLCAFLDKPIPDEAYPRVNEGDGIFQVHVGIFWVVLSKLVLAYVVPVLLVGFAVWYQSWW